jgi:predicted permease
MRIIRAVLVRLVASFFRKAWWERELAAEIESNLELQIEHNRRAGMTPAEARRTALLKFGGVESIKESCRDQKGLPLLESLVQDLRHSLRTLRKSPVFALAAVVSLVLGIGANTAIFSLIDALLLRELPVREPHRLFALTQTGRRVSLKSSSNIHYGLFRQLEEEHQILSGIFTFHGAPRSNVTVGSQGEVTDALMVSQDYFRVLGVQPQIGRKFESGEDNVALISHRYWKRRFAGDLSVLGRSIAINGAPYTVIGVTPPEFFGPIVGTWIDVTIPAFGGGTRPMAGDEPVAWVMGRLADGVTEQQAAAGLTTRASAWMESRGSRERPAIVLEPASRGFSFLRAQFSKPLYVLMAMVALVLLIACANVAGLLLARTSTRQQEFAIRLGIGASRGRLVRLLLTESILLSLLGGVAGLLFARWSAGAVAAFVSTVKDPVGLDTSVNMHVFSFAVLVAALTGMLFGVAPALHGTRLDLTAALKQGGRSTAAAIGMRLRRVLVAGQVALAVLLVAGATLFARSLTNLKNIDTGFRRDSVLMLSLDPAQIGYKDQQIAQSYEQILDRIERVPGVRSATFLRNNLLATAASLTSIVVPGRLPRPEDDMELAPGMKMASAARSFTVGPRFVETLGMTLLEGRDLLRTDRFGTPLVAVVNESFARYFFPGESAVGKRFGYGPDKPNAVEIVGVVSDVKHKQLREPATRTMYTSALQDPGSWRDTTLNIRTAIDPARVAPSVRQAIADVAPGLPVFNVTTLQRMFDDSVVTERTLALLSGFFGILALLLVSIGLYALLAYSVEKRQNEIGVRLALGARPEDVLTMVVRETAVLIVTGLTLGLAATIVAGRWIATYLYGLTPADPTALALTVAALGTVGVLSVWMPARKAAHTDPMIALRHE